MAEIRPISVEEARGRILEQRHATAESSLIDLLERGEIVAGVDEDEQMHFMRPVLDGDRLE